MLCLGMNCGADERLLAKSSSDSNKNNTKRHNVVFSIGPLESSMIPPHQTAHKTELKAVAAPQTMLATPRLPTGVRAKLHKPCLVARALGPCGIPSSVLYSRRLRPALLVERCRGLSSAPSIGGSRESSSVRLWDAKGWGVRCLSDGAANVTHGSITETPAIPSFIEIRLVSLGGRI